MKKYILVHEPIDPNESPSIVRQFDTREEAEAFDMWSAGDTTALFLFMIDNCKVEEKPFKPMGYDSVFDLSAGYLIYDRDGMDEQLILVKRQW